ncbi:SDR family oxidoreductase [Candidatus Woesearchaeota archaeon]|nr:SDR family oxidoreductase [Candidatus Woesearchaeota archaeon]
MDSLEGKKVVVTGGANGIGAALCRLMRIKGANVLSIDKFPPKNPELGIEYLSADVTDAASLQAAFSRIGLVDCLVNNAGVMRRGSLFDLSEEDYDLLFDVNVKGYWLVLKSAKPFLRKGAAVVVMSSRHALGLPQDPGVYALTKQADIGLAEIFAKTYPEYDVKILCPGSIDTSLGRHQVEEAALEKKKKVMLAPDALAGKIISLLLSDKKWLVFDESSADYSVR